MKNPYSKILIDEASGVEVTNRDHRIWQEGYDSAKLTLCPTCQCDMDAWQEVFGEDHVCYAKEEIVDSSMGKWIDPDTFVYQGVEYTIKGFEVVEK